MASRFQAAMEKMAVIGQNTRELIDCSEAVPQPLPAVKKPATFPAGKSAKDVERSCFSSPFPTLSADRTYFLSNLLSTRLIFLSGGPATLIPHCPPSQGGDADACDDDEGSL